MFLKLISFLFISSFLPKLTLSGKVYPLCTKSGRVCSVDNGECCSEHRWCGSGDAWCNENSWYPNPNNTVGDTKAPVRNPTRAPSKNPIKHPTRSPVKIYRPTHSPTHKPTNEPTKKSTRKPNQIIKGCVCRIEGDPHISMFNCGHMHYQGPHRYDPPGSYEYITRCYGFHISKMPFDVIGTHVRWGPYFTALDYLTVKLYDNEGVIHYIKINGKIGVQISNDNINWNNIKKNITKIGSKFNIKWDKLTNNLVEFDLDIDGDECNNALHIDTYRVTNTVEQAAANIKLSDCYKGYTCGLCGSYSQKWPLFETKQSNTIILDSGMFGRTAENYNGFGYLIKGSRSQQRRLTETSYNISKITSACLNMETDLLNKCIKQLPKYKDCCLTKHGYCERTLTEYCKIDSCACIGYDMNKNGLTTKDQVTTANIDTLCVENTMSSLMSFICKLPENDFIIPLDSLPKNFENGFCDSLVESKVVEAMNNNLNNGKINWGTVGISFGAGVVVCLLIGGLSYLLCCKKKNKQYDNVPIDSSDTDNVADSSDTEDNDANI